MSNTFNNFKLNTIVDNTQLNYDASCWPGPDPVCTQGDFKQLH